MVVMGVVVMCVVVMGVVVMCVVVMGMGGYVCGGYGMGVMWWLWVVD